MPPKKKKEDLLKRGRKTTYTDAIADKICEAVSISTDGLDKICARNPEFPEAWTLYKWRIKYPYFAQKYEDAKRNQAELLANQIIEIADDSSRDVLVKIDANGEEREVVNTEFVQRSRLRVDARKWIVSRLLPKIYGDKTTTESTVTIKHEDLLKELE